MLLLSAHLRCKIISFPKLLLLRFHNPTPTLTFITNSYSNSSSSTNPLIRYIPLNDSINHSKKTSESLSPGMFSQEDGKKFIQLESESEEEIKVSSKTQEDAEKIAITAIAAKALTALELKTKLKTKGFTSDIIDKVLSNMQGRGYINDYMYAETFSRSRWSSLTWGPTRIKQALQRKGISESDVQKATKYVFESSGESVEDGNGSAIGMSKESMDHLLVQATKQWLRGQNVPIEKKKARLIRWLQYRGFNWGIINVILKKLQSQYPC